MTLNTKYYIELFSIWWHYTRIRIHRSNILSKSNSNGHSFDTVLFVNEISRKLKSPVRKKSSYLKTKMLFKVTTDERFYYLIRLNNTNFCITVSYKGKNLFGNSLKGAGKCRWTLENDLVACKYVYQIISLIIEVAIPSDTKFSYESPHMCKFFRTYSYYHMFSIHLSGKSYTYMYVLYS